MALKKMPYQALVLFTFISLVFLGATQGLCEEGLAGEWTGWGRVHIQGQDGVYTGTYTDTYGTGPGTMYLKKTGNNTYEGSWRESNKRHGTFSLILSPDGRTVGGMWRADDDCTISPGQSGSVHWKRK